MADDKDIQDGRDRAKVAGGEPYEVEYFAQKHGITTGQARELIAKHGNNRETLDQEAKKLA